MDADGMEHVACSVGTGPVDSAYKAVDLIVKVWNKKLVIIYSFVVVRFQLIFDISESLKPILHKLGYHWQSLLWIVEVL